MKADWRNNRDFFAGLMFIVTGAGGWFMARDYPFGSALRMGPGYFPTVLSVMMIVAGVYVMLMGLRNGEKIKGNWSIRALIVLPLATVLFGVLMEESGFIAAMIALCIVSAASSKEFKWLEVILLTVGLTITCAAGFIYGLGLPYPLIKGLWGY
jgi:hypothetical protein